MSWFSERRTPTIVLLLAGGIGLLGLWGFRTSDGAVKARERDARLASAQEEAQDGGSNALAPTLEVETLVVRAAPAAQTIELAGRLEPVRRTWVAAEIAGRIVDVPVAEFSRVAGGDLLVRIDDALPRADLVRAQATHRLAKAELERQQRLGRSSVASEAELERAAAEERRTWAALLEARTRVGHTRIQAPFDGLVNALDLDPGAYVQPGTNVAEVLDLSVLEVTVLVGDRQIASLAPGDPVKLRIDVLGSALRPGRVVRVAGAPQDGGTRYPVVVALEEAEPTDAEAETEAAVPMPGMLAHVRFEVGRDEALRVPARAVQREFELDYVFVVDDEARAERVRVDTRPVPFRPDQLEITSGLEDGSRVAVTAVDQLRTGLRVIVR